LIPGPVSEADADPHEDVVERLEKTNEQPDQIVEDLFLGALSRRPTLQEKRRLTDYVKKCRHKQTAYRDYPLADGGLPVTERLAGEVISLPMHAYLDEATQDRIVAAVRGALRA